MLALKTVYWILRLRQSVSISQIFLSFQEPLQKVPNQPLRTMQANFSAADWGEHFLFWYLECELQQPSIWVSTYWNGGKLALISASAEQPMQQRTRARFFVCAPARLTDEIKRQTVIAKFTWWWGNGGCVSHEDGAGMRFPQLYPGNPTCDEQDQLLYFRGARYCFAMQMLSKAR